ncbi:MAG TPA: amino acid--tRNA ligase-related protein [Treponemataceae bacterium]|nr:amino acid--tRNA ligase-related protein [Treponemataceae bacterium]
MDIERLKFRAQTIQKLRNFFLDDTPLSDVPTKRPYLELDTPALSPDLIPESCLEVFKTNYIFPYTGKKKPLYLVPSPEIYIKKIIAQHTVNCFQISKCYRNVESSSKMHNPEFTMLEYYTIKASYIDSLKITEKLFEAILPVQPDKKDSTHIDLFSNLRPPFLRMSVNKAFEKYAGGKISEWFFTNTPIIMAAKQARKLGITESKSAPFESWTLEELYNLIFVQFVEPSLPKNRPVVLMDYPAFVNCLAKKTKNSQNSQYKCVERWELYCRGIELANCYSEETDPEKIKAFYNEETPLKNSVNTIVPHAIDKNYYTIFKDFPTCSGVAMGVDRLIALLSDCNSITPILPFPLLYK